MSCIACRNRRNFARGVDLFWWSPLKVCYPHWLKRRSRLHIAGRVSMVCIVAAVAVYCVCAWAHKVAWDFGGLVGR